jgi:phospholipid transport system substrate-binding protein
MHSIIHKSFIALVFVCSAGYGTGAFAAAATTPTDQVRTAVDEVLKILQDGSLQSDTRRQMIRDAIAPHFDFRAMSQSTLAQSWKKATPEQKERFMVLFQKLLENVYIVAMETYSGETVRYGQEKLTGERASVETFIVQPNGPEIPIQYRMRLKQNQWLAYDVIIENVSLVSNYRTSFRQIARRQGMDALLKRLQEKVDGQLKADA